MVNLEVLKNNRDALLLAEVAALLHDWQKCIDMAVASQWSKNPLMNKTSKLNIWQSRGSQLQPGRFAQALSSIHLQLGSNSSIDLKTLCEEGRNPSSAKSHSNPLVSLLGACHDQAHVDKELGENEQIKESCDWISTAFGFEDVQPNKLLQPLLLKVLPLLSQISYSNRTNLLSKIREVFSNAWGDTRRPINEVTLWDWGYAVSALYKSVLAAKLIQAGTSRWRLLRINFDVLGLYAKAIKIADLLGYQRVVDQACEAVKKLIEEEYPLGNEIYRDSTGIYFTFPDLDLPADLAQEIRCRVERVEMELAPRIAVTVGDGKTAAEQLKGILGKARKEALEALAQPFDSQNLSACWQQQWETADDGKWEICPVCRLRPMREGNQVCETCLQRRVSRIKTWESDPGQTIWIDEIADHNDRVALIVGHFGLDDWLSGDLVQTMLVKAVPGNPNDCVPKNPSPARLRRIWETCQRFWRTESQPAPCATAADAGQDEWLARRCAV
jgi:CRISPR-associated Csx11 family protein